MNETVTKILQEGGVRPSYHRVRILEYLLENHSHPTAEEVYSFLSEEVPVLSKATVYNTLNTFAEKGIVKAIPMHASGIRYDVMTKQHGHFLCTICGEIYDFPYEEKAEDLAPEGFQVKTTEVTLKGHCRKCAAAAPAKEK